MGSFKKNKDLHIIKYFSSLISISDGKVADVTPPTLLSCPLAKHLYKEPAFAPGSDKEAVKQAIIRAIESKIRDYGFFTSDRKFVCEKTSIKYGASEMMMSALKRNAIDAAVVVCDGAGTVITDRPEAVQGIGARMNTIISTSPISAIQESLKQLDCRVVFNDGTIDQVRGVEEAIKAGYKNIAVTVRGDLSDDLVLLRALEQKYGVNVVCLVVCTTGVDTQKISVMRKCADLVWSCASSDIREIIGPCAKTQLSKLIPVFVLTSKGERFVSAQGPNKKEVNNKKIDK